MVIPLSRAQFHRHVSALARILKKNRDGSATRLVVAVLHLWQVERYPLLARDRAPWGSAVYANDPTVVGFVSWLDGRSFDEAAYWLATAYSLLVDEETRVGRSLFFTPPGLAKRVIRNLVQHGASLTQHRWHDPACGGAAFLVPIAQRVMRAMQHAHVRPRQILRHIETHVSGNDFDSTLLDLSRSFLEMALYGLIKKTGYRPQFQLLMGDGLTSEEVERLRPDVIACNPPYRKLKEVEVANYRDKHGDIAEYQPNIYGLFINRTIGLARIGGLVGLLTPTSFLSGKSFSKLRTKLLHHSDALQIDVLSDRSAMFIKVEQGTAITVLKTKKRTKVVTHRTAIHILDRTGKSRVVGARKLPNSGSSWPIPLTAEDFQLVQSAEATGFKLQDYGYAATVGHLVGYRDERRRFAKPPKRKTSGRILPLVWATDILQNGTFEHCRKQGPGRPHGFVEVDDLNSPGVVTHPAVILQRLTSSDQSNRLVAAVVPEAWVRRHGGFVCENHVIVLAPGDGALPPRQFADLLNSRPVDRVFRSICGASNVSISELHQLPLPDAAVLKRALSNGQDLDEAVERAYKTNNK